LTELDDESDWYSEDDLIDDRVYDNNHLIHDDRFYARHPRRYGSVLIVGIGSVGGYTAEELAKLGFSLWLVDYDTLGHENLVRHVLGAAFVDRGKASSFKEHLNTNRPWCDVHALDKNFLRLSRRQQLELVSRVDVVVAATDSVECQRRINEVCVAARVPAAFPGIVIHRDLQDAEMGEILWVDPSRHTPCYFCATSWLSAASGAQARGGTGPDINLIALATVWVIAALLAPDEERSQILNAERTCLVVHGFMPTSAPLQQMLGPRLFRNNRIQFLDNCPVCGGAVGSPRQLSFSGPLADFTVKANGMSIDIDASPTYTDPESTAFVRYTFDWGDGKIVERSPYSWAYHKYDEPGLRRLSVTADSEDGTSTVTKDIDVRPKPLIK
jgi:hypothetical protein